MCADTDRGENLATIRCDLCGKALAEQNQPYRIEHVGMRRTVEHDRCRDIFNRYLEFKTMHDGMCHLPDCPYGPTNPFEHQGCLGPGCDLKHAWDVP